ncbi:MAG TPA: nucleotidyltransferase domain-containing protein [Thermoplasmata archaeon]|nr:nucleotidyltransferase domain-containing protein [Thermoplasmata archaeon]
MPSATGLSIPASFLRFRERFGDEPFSVSDAAQVLRARPYLELSRLARLGWLFRIGRGRYATVDPLVRLTAGVETNLRPFRSKCFYPILYRSAGEILRLYSGRLRAIALFGSCARGTSGPESDLDLLVLLTERPISVYEDARERGRLDGSAAPLLVDEFDRTKHYHRAQVLVATEEDFARPAPVLFDLPQEARILYDPDGSLRSALRRLSRLLREKGARRIARAGEAPYWKLGTILEATA